MVAHNPLHGSGRAGLLHPALASGNDAKAYPRIRMTDACMRKPPCNLALHPSPGQMTFLAAPFEHSPPVSSQCHAKVTDRHCIHRHSVVTHMAKQNRAHIGTHLGHGLMHTPTKLGLDSSKLRLPPRAHRLSKHRKPSLARLSATVRESQEVKGLGLALTSALPVFFRMPAELNQARLLGMQFQPKTNQPFPKLTQEPLPILSVLETNNEVIRKPHHHHIPLGFPKSPLLNPKVEHIVQVDVGQQRTDTSALNRPHSLSLRLPSSTTPALSHFWISRTTRRSATRCSINFTSHPCSSVSKKARMSQSSTQFTLLLMIPSVSASNAWCRLLLGRNP